MGRGCASGIAPVDERQGGGVPYLSASWSFCCGEDAQIRIENEQLMVKRKIEESNGDRILQFTYSPKSYEIRNTIKQKSNQMIWT